jgi:hypothetical protein
MRQQVPGLAAFLAEPWSPEHTPVVYDTLLLLWLAVKDSSHELNLESSEAAVANSRLLWAERFRRGAVGALFDGGQQQRASDGGGGGRLYYIGV